MTRSKLLNSLRIQLMKRCPALYVPLARLAARGMFRAERAVLNGRPLPASEVPSVLHFCYNRCGSRYISTLIQRLVVKDQLEHLDFARYFTHCDARLMVKLDEKEFLGKAGFESGHHLGPFYKLTEGIVDFSTYRILLTLRDPRDVLTSRYFSQAFAHTLFDKAGIERRKRVQQMTVDEFVLEQLPELEERYLRYADRLLGRDNVLCLPYEKMVGNFPEWLLELAKFLGVEESSPVVQKILQEADFSVKKEDKFSHRRSVQPGNHKKKLQPETVAELNHRLKPVLERFGYEVEEPVSA